VNYKRVLDKFDKMAEENKSIWQKISDYRPFLGAFAKAFYRTTTLPFRIPTFLRVYQSGESLISNFLLFIPGFYPPDKEDMSGLFYGCLAGIGTDLALSAGLLTHNIINDNYVPLTVAGATVLTANAASATYESIRYLYESRNRKKKNLEQITAKSEK